MMIPEMGKVYNLGKPETEGILDGPVIVQEKVDGSQFSFMVDADGELHCRSKSASIDPWNPPAMFAAACATVLNAYTAERLERLVVYRGEAFRGPKHNVLQYARAPRGGLALFAVDFDEEWLAGDTLVRVADELGTEAVTVFGDGVVVDEADLSRMLATESMLGGVPVEGVVVRSLSMVDRWTGRPLVAKLVSEAFRETKKRPRPSKEPGRDIVETIAETYATEARWAKAAQHLREEGKLSGTMRDMPLLIAEVARDVLDEEGDVIRSELLAWAQQRGLAKKFSNGLAEWYRAELGER